MSLSARWTGRCVSIFRWSCCSCKRALGITTLIVTHDQEEAQSLANRLVLMNKGNVEQIDTPMAVTIGRNRCL